MRKYTTHAIKHLSVKRRNYSPLWVVLLFACVWGSSSWAEEFNWDEMSLEDLMEVEVFSASKREEPLFVSPAAVYVLTAEEIHRSGATSIPDVLRGVPGVEVGRIDASKWARSEEHTSEL